MTMPWFKFYPEARTDRKLRSLSRDQRLVWLDLLCYASEQSDRGIIRFDDDGLLALEVADGGTNAMDNLVAACQSCNGGKSARSLDEAPGSSEAVAIAEQRAVSLREQADALKTQRDAEERLREEMVNLICSQYHVKTFRITDANLGQLIAVFQRHGAGVATDWIGQAARRGVKTTQLARYIHGIIRNISRGEAGAEQ